MRAYLGGPVCADEDDRGVEEVAGEVLEEVPGVGVGPVEVLDPDRDGPVVAEVADEVEDGGEEAARAELVAGSGRIAAVEPAGQRGEVLRLGEQRRVGAPDLAKEVRQRRQRDDVAADGDATADVEVHTGTFGSFGDERRLADSGISADEQGRRDPRPGVREGAFEQGQLVDSSDEVGVLRSVSHGVLIMTPRI